MKKTFLLVSLSVISFCSFAQRNVDLAITLTSPDSTTAIVGTQPFNFAATLTNNGPDSIKTTDTLVLALYLDNSSSPASVVINSQTYTTIASAFNTAVASGASGNLSLSMAFASDPGTGAHQLCVAAIVLNRSATDSVHETQPANNKACTTINIQNPAAVPNVAGNSNAIAVYPSPATSVANIKLSLSVNEQVTVTVTDMLGHTIYKVDNGTMPAGTSVLHVDTQNLPAGTYLYNVQTGAQTNYGKFVVAH